VCRVLDSSSIDQGVGKNSGTRDPSKGFQERVFDFLLILFDIEGAIELRFPKPFRESETISTIKKGTPAFPELNSMQKM
jgi:hypothetical protein